MSHSEQGGNEFVPQIGGLKPLKNKENQLGTVENYSTVIVHSSNVPNTPHLHNKNYYLTMVVRVTSSNLWISPYSNHQQKLFDIIKEKHDDEV